MESGENTGIHAEEDVHMAPAMLIRGFCHGCSREVAAKEVEPDEFACPLCSEVGIVECPLEGYERWSGNWHAEYADGSRSGFAISDAGQLSVTTGGALGTPSPVVQMEWAASDALAQAAEVASDSEAPRPQAFMFCARGHRLHATEYFRLEDDGSLTVRLVLEPPPQEGTGGRSVTEGRATRPPPPVAMRQVQALDVNSIFSNFVNGFTESFQASNQNPGEAQGMEGLVSAMDAGFQRLANNASGLSEQQRQHISQQGQHVSQFLARLAAGDNQQMPFMTLGMNGPFNFGFDPAFVDAAFGGNNPRQQERTGVPEALARRFCEEHEIETLPEGVERGDDGWMCPICYLGADAGKLVLLCEGDAKEGRNSHVYHQQCAVNWLSRANTCPFCRRSPVVPLPPPAPFAPPQMFFQHVAWQPGQGPGTGQPAPAPAQQQAEEETER